MNRWRIHLFNKIAVSVEDSLNPGRVALVCLCHSVPVEGPHHLLALQDQVLGFVVICEALSRPVTQRRPTQNCPNGYSQVRWEARPHCSTPMGGSP
jgi:hypothetical protein